MKILKYALIVLFAVGMMSCGSSGGGGDDTDTEAPTISVTSPMAITVVDAGTNLAVSFTAEDNVAVESYVLTVAYSGAKSTKVVVEFSFNSASDTDASGNAVPSISGASSSVNFQMAIADDAKPGMYKMVIKVTDTSDNISAAKEVTFEIK
ncbi:MAG: DUF4625 domain-containing protein [Labilibaculum sp.]|nr:DUF4625 domain-containing protein [Labilibaculum sp.]